MAYLNSLQIFIYHDPNINKIYPKSVKTYTLSSLLLHFCKFTQ